jgi:Ca2+-binding EF-hand superfamily protein
MMKRLVVYLLIVSLMTTAFGCAKKNRHHDTDLPDPKSFNAHFGDIDTDGDGNITLEEFKAYFDHADENVFKALDLNGNGTVDHDEWHQFKEAHGLRHHD